MSAQHSIRADLMDLLLASAKMRRANGGRTAQFCLLSSGPTLTTHCHDRHRAAMRDAALRMGPNSAAFVPMQRGGIAALYERTRLHHGLAEVNRTWGAGIRALRAEPRYVLNGGGQ